MPGGGKLQSISSDCTYLRPASSPRLSASIYIAAAVSVQPFVSVWPFWVSVSLLVASAAPILQQLETESGEGENESFSFDRPLSHVRQRDWREESGGLYPFHAVRTLYFALAMDSFFIFLVRGLVTVCVCVCVCINRPVSQTDLRGSTSAALCNCSLLA